MSSDDIESRLERQLSTKAMDLPSKPDRLDRVRSRGRRRQVVSRAAISIASLAAVLAVVGVGSTIIDPPTESTEAVGEADADVDADTDVESPPETLEVEGAEIEGAEIEGAEIEGSEIDGTEIDGAETDGAGTDGAEADGVDESEGAAAGSDESGTEAQNGSSESDAGLAEIGDFSYAGAFRLSSDDFGASNSNYAIGAMAYNPERNSLFIAGHSHDNAIAEFEIPASLGTGSDVGDLPVVNRPRQPFTILFDRVSNPDGIDRVTGMYVTNGSLVVNAENWNDAGGTAKDTSLVIPDADSIDGDIEGFYELEGRAMAGGYMSPVPEEWQAAIGGPVITGWASNYSIISRYSVGPTLFGFDPQAMIGSAPGPIKTTEQLAFPFDEGKYLSPDALKEGRGSASATWNLLSRGVYGFIVPGTRTFAVIGSSGGIDSGLGDTIVRDDGTDCPGPCSYADDDNYNYYWLFDLDDVLAADDNTAQPYSFGRWEVPFDDDGDHLIIGATLDERTSTLYMSLAEAGQVGTYDRPPLILAYKVG